MMEPSSALAAHPVFAGLAPDRLAPLLAQGREVVLAPNGLLFGKGSPGDGIYLVLAGAVVIRREAVGEPIERVRDLPPGELFGEIEALDGSPRQFSARALGATRVLHLPQAALAPFLAAQTVVEHRLRALAVERRTSRMRAMLAPSTRHEQRIRIDREVLLSMAARTPVRARLEDLAPGGLCLSDAPAGFRLGAPVEFTLGLDGAPDLLAVRGAVRWSRDGLVGIGFEKVDSGKRREVARALLVLLEGR